MINAVFIFLIVISFAFYFYFKTKQFRSELPIAKKWYANRALMALGSLLFFFGLNQLFLFPTTLTYVISGLFIVIGLFTVINYYRVAKHYGQFVEEEFNLNKK
ncbi:YtpI family protein [Paenisporosarcina sp. NPDC076898]|uniref:YtpI family protein n=1 Tax=unclassified Paenisporosarcina TaxID=2642018 RepID=UPI003CFD6F00